MKNSRLPHDVEYRHPLPRIENCCGLKIEVHLEPYPPPPPPAELGLLMEKLDNIGLVCGDLRCIAISIVLGTMGVRYSVFKLNDWAFKAPEQGRWQALQ